MKKVLIGVAVVVVIAIVGVVVLYSNIDSIIKTAVEDVGSRATQAKVTLNEVELSPTSGEGALRGFTLGNPPGYNTANAMKFSEVKVKVDVGTVTNDTIVIKEVVIAGPQITYEVGGNAGSNLQQIQKNVDAFAGGPAGKPAETGTEEGGGKKLIIENLYVRTGRIGVSAPFLGGKQLDATLPDIHLKDIGKEKNGATPAEVADKLMTEITRRATQVVSKLPGIDKAMDAIKGGTEGMKKMMEEGAQGGSKTLEDSTKGVGDAVKGLFGGEKKN